MPIPSPPGRAWCSCRRSRPRRLSMCYCAGFPARSCSSTLGCSWSSTGSSMRSSKRHAAHPRVLNRQSGRLHGRRHRHRHRDGPQRHCVTRFHAYRLQGAPADVGRLGALHDRQAQVQRVGGPLPHHAADDHLRYRWRAVDLVFPADLRFRLQIDDFGSRGEPASGACLVPARGGFRRCLPARRHQLPWFVFFARTPDSGLPTHPGTCAWLWCSSP